MRRVDRMDLHGEVGGASQRAVGLQRGDHLARACRDARRRRRSGRRPSCPRQVAGRGEPVRACLRQRRSRRGASPPCGRRRRTPCARRGCAARGPWAAPRDRRRSSGSGCRPAAPWARRPGAAGCATASGRRRPAGPARALDENVACQMRSTRRRARRIELVAAGQRAAAPRRSRISSRLPFSSSWRSSAVEAEGGEGGQVAARPDADFQAAAARSGRATAASSATRTGSSSGRVTMPVPSRMREVCAGDLGEEHERRRQAALVLVEMMLGDPGRIEAAALGMRRSARWPAGSARPRRSRRAGG